MWIASLNPTRIGRLRRELVWAARRRASRRHFVISDYGYGAATPAILNAVRYKGGLPRSTRGAQFALSHAAIFQSGAAAHTERTRDRGCARWFGQDWRMLCTARHKVISQMENSSPPVDAVVAFTHRHKPTDIPRSDQVADVTGAGDTVIAHFRRSTGRRSQR